jgi:hypothetical protein
LANGGNGDTFAGGGSGGGIKITTDRISGAGLVQAKGGNGASQSGGGGGGRIAIYYNVAADLVFTNVQAQGGTGLNIGGAGTIFLKQGSAIPQIVIRGQRTRDATSATPQWRASAHRCRARFRPNVNLTSLTLSQRSGADSSVD